MATPVPHVFFGNAWAWFPLGFPRNWQRQVSMRRRPEEDGADIIRSGLTPVLWASQVTLLAVDILSANAFIRRWEALTGEVRDLHLLVGIPWHLSGVCLHNAYLVAGPKKVEAATDGVTQFVAKMSLTLGRVASVTPAA